MGHRTILVFGYGNGCREFSQDKQLKHEFDQTHGIIHAIKNIGDTDMVLIVYSNESFNADDPDTFYEQILE